MRVNGSDVNGAVEPRLLLVHYLRGTAGVHSPRIGCDTTSCGACTVLMDGRAVKSCTVLAVQADGSNITTLEGLTGANGELHPMQEAFWQEHGLQCGYCTAGLIMAALPVVTAADGELSEQAVRQAISGNICRCTGYVAVVRAVQLAARLIKERDAGS
jgi:carbon-monoxide dehydrogenase small subunit